MLTFRLEISEMNRGCSLKVDERGEGVCPKVYELLVGHEGAQVRVETRVDVVFRSKRGTSAKNFPCGEWANWEAGGILSTRWKELLAGRWKRPSMWWTG
jgi:hypothetical protein